MIIGSAITLAILKIAKKFNGKKKKSQVNFKKESFSMQHNCSDCSAECMLRDAAPPIIRNNQELCKKIEIKSDKL
jgi:hypothetical protein